MTDRQSLIHRASARLGEIEMSEKNWTPGPWSICDGPVGYGHRIYSEAMPEELAVVCDVTLARDVSVLATAPELYEALVAARAELAGLPRSLGYDIDSLPMIDAVLKKARGAQ